MLKRNVFVSSKYFINVKLFGELIKLSDEHQKISFVSMLTDIIM